MRDQQNEVGLVEHAKCFILRQKAGDRNRVAQSEQRFAVDTLFKVTHKADPQPRTKVVRKRKHSLCKACGFRGTVDRAQIGQHDGLV